MSDCVLEGKVVSVGAEGRTRRVVAEVGGGGKVEAVLPSGFLLFLEGNRVSFRLSSTEPEMVDQEDLVLRYRCVTAGKGSSLLSAGGLLLLLSDLSLPPFPQEVFCAVRAPKEERPKRKRPEPRVSKKK